MVGEEKYNLADSTISALAVGVGEVGFLGEAERDHALSSFSEDSLVTDTSLELLRDAPIGVCSRGTGGVSSNRLFAYDFRRRLLGSFPFLAFCFFFFNFFGIDRSRSVALAELRSDEDEDA